jgi:hypothetical protein
MRGLFVHPPAPDEFDRKQDLAPGESITNTFHLNRIYDMTISEQYTITDGRSLWNKSDPDRSHNVEVVSKALVIRVVEDP